MKCERVIDYKGFSIIIWNKRGNRSFFIGTKEFPHVPAAKEYINNITSKEDAYQDDEGVWRWKSNDRVPFDDMLQDWAVSSSTMEKCRKARDNDNEKFIKEYRERMKDYVPSNETLYEMRAAFGEGVEVVNVITGKTIKL